MAPFQGFRRRAVSAGFRFGVADHGRGIQVGQGGLHRTGGRRLNEQARPGAAFRAEGFGKRGTAGQQIGEKKYGSGPFQPTDHMKGLAVQLKWFHAGKVSRQHFRRTRFRQAS